MKVVNPVPPTVWRAVARVDGDREWRGCWRMKQATAERQAQRWRDGDPQREVWVERWTGTADDVIVRVELPR